MLYSTLPFPVVIKVLKVTLALRAIRETGDSEVNREFLGNRASRVNKEILVLKANKVFVGNKASKALQDNKVSKEFQVSKGNKEFPDKKAIKENQVMKVLRESKEFLAQQAVKEFPDKKAIKVFQVMMVPRVFLEVQVLLVLLVPKAIQAILGHVARKVIKAFRVMTAQLLDPREILVIKVLVLRYKEPKPQ
jgi:hypothetical protein